MVEDWWLALNQKFLDIQTDESVVMPNHFHGTITINRPPVGADPRVCPELGIGHATDREWFHGRVWANTEVRPYGVGAVFLPNGAA